MFPRGRAERAPVVPVPINRPRLFPVLRRAKCEPNRPIWAKAQLVEGELQEACRTAQKLNAMAPGKATDRERGGENQPHRQYPPHAGTASPREPNQIWRELLGRRQRPNHNRTARGNAWGVDSGNRQERIKKCRSNPPLFRHRKPGDRLFLVRRRFHYAQGFFQLLVFTFRRLQLLDNILTAGGDRLGVGRFVFELLGQLGRLGLMTFDRLEMGSEALLVLASLPSLVTSFLAAPRLRLISMKRVTVSLTVLRRSVCNSRRRT